MKKRRDSMYSFNTLIEKEYGEKLEKITANKNILKTDWLRQKIEEDYKKL